MNIRRRTPAVFVLCAAFLVACSLNPPPETPDVVQDALPPTTEIPAGWTGPVEDSGYVDDGWLASFQNPDLDALVAEAIGEHNPNMRALAAQVDRAAASARLAGAALKPTVGLGADLSGTSVGGTAVGTKGDVGVGVSWEVDVWGKLRAGREAADVTLQATVLDVEFARMSLAANVAKTWFVATKARVLVRLAQETVEILNETTRLTEQQQEVGQATMQDVYLARAQRDQAENALRQAIGARKQLQRALEILVGRYPSAEIEGSSELSPLPGPVPVGVPSDIIQRRPDLVAAERRVAAAFYLTEQANLARLPSFTLNAGVSGFSNLDDAIGQLGAGLVAPIFSGGAISAQIDQANADQEAAMAAYGQSLLQAFEEVETSMTNEDLFAQQESFLISAEENSRWAYKLAQEQYNVGQTDLLSVLIIQGQWVGAQVGVVNIRSDRLTQRVDLHLALGGSFEKKPEEENEKSQ